MADPHTQQVAQAYEYCRQIVRNHYENFPVASLILPKAIRQPISVIYAFARSADDFADEGDWNTETRLTKLREYDERLDQIAVGETGDDPIFLALADVIQQHALPLSLFHDLISAFRQDVTKKRYATIDEVWDYSRRSANPVGRLLLHLTRQDSPKNLQQSDAVCSALQLINFLQDIEQDFMENQRIYLPQEDMDRFHVSEQHISEKRSDDAMRQLVQEEIRMAREKMLIGEPLGRGIHGRFGFQLRIMINGGLRILELLEQQRGDYFSRPRLKGTDWLWMVWRAIWKIPYRSKEV
jgi:hydroxysqualene synthase